MDDNEVLRKFLKDFFNQDIPYSHFSDIEYPGLFSAVRRYTGVIRSLGVPVKEGITTYALKRPGAHENHVYTVWSNDKVTWGTVG